jgi:hypothetical protein
VAARRRKKRPGNPLGVQAAAQGDYVWHPEDKAHSWTCDKCGETIKARPDLYNSRLSHSQFAMENNLKVIGAKSIDHVRRNCGPEPRPAYRRDLDN